MMLPAYANVYSKMINDLVTITESHCPLDNGQNGCFLLGLVRVQICPCLCGHQFSPGLKRSWRARVLGLWALVGPRHRLRPSVNSRVATCSSQLKQKAGTGANFPPKHCKPLLSPRPAAIIPQDVVLTTQRAELVFCNIFFLWIHIITFALFCDIGRECVIDFAFCAFGVQCRLRPKEPGCRLSWR